MKGVEDERIKRFIEIMNDEYGVIYTEEEAEEIYEVVDRIDREMSG